MNSSMFNRYRWFGLATTFLSSIKTHFFPCASYSVIPLLRPPLLDYDTQPSPSSHTIINQKAAGMALVLFLSARILFLFSTLHFSATLTFTISSQSHQPDLHNLKHINSCVILFFNGRPCMTKVGWMIESSQDSTPCPLLALIWVSPPLSQVRISIR